MNASAVIFDLDGTLLDTLSSLAEAYNQVLTEMGCSPRPVDEYRMIIGDGVRNAVIRALPEDVHEEALIIRGMSRFREIYENTWQSATPYPGIEELLHSLNGRIPIGVLSNKDNGFTRQCVDYFFGAKTFDVVVGFREGLRHKPDPAGGLLVAEELGCQPENCLLIGDTSTDMLTAAACNMTGVGVLWGFRDRQELTESGAQYLLDQPADLYELLDN